MYAEMLACCALFLLAGTLVIWDAGRTALKLWPDLVVEWCALRLAIRAGSEAYRRKRCPRRAMRIAGQVWWRMGSEPAPHWPPAPA